MEKLGRKMINLSLSIWTDKIPGAPEGEVLPKHCWNAGTLRLKSNTRHGIEGSRAKPWNKPDELVPLLMKLLEEAGVTIHELTPSKAKRSAANQT